MDAKKPPLAVAGGGFFWLSWRALENSCSRKQKRTYLAVTAKCMPNSSRKGFKRHRASSPSGGAVTDLDRALSTRAMAMATAAQSPSARPHSHARRQTPGLAAAPSYSHRDTAGLPYFMVESFIRVHLVLPKY
jgi:hypothetical protein